MALYSAIEMDVIGFLMFEGTLQYYGPKVSPFHVVNGVKCLKLYWRVHAHKTPYKICAGINIPGICTGIVFLLISPLIIILTVSAISV